MSQFKYAQDKTSFPPPPPPRTLPPTHGGATIEVDTLIHWGTLIFLIVSILVITYLLISKCTAYWNYRIKHWRYGGRKKQDSDDDDCDDEENY